MVSDELKVDPNRKFSKLCGVWAFYRGVKTYMKEANIESLSKAVDAIQESSEDRVAEAVRTQWEAVKKGPVALLREVTGFSAKKAQETLRTMMVLACR